MKKLGIIGGLGPMATSYFIRRVTEMTDAVSDQEHIEMIIHSKPQIPDRTKFITGDSNKSPMPDLLDIGEELKERGADIIVMPCVTAHFFWKELEGKVGCKVINAIEETAEYLKKFNIKRAGIMATQGAVKSRIFQSVFLKYGIECIEPSKADEEEIMNIIYNNVKAGKDVDITAFERISDTLFKKGAQVIVLGCTELSVIKRDHNMKKGYLDVIDVLARSSVINCAKLKDDCNYLFTE